MKDFKYYTLFGVRLSCDADMKPKYSRDFILRWTTNEREACDLAKMMIENELAPTPQNEALEAVGITEEGASIFAIQTRLRFNPEITTHLFETDFVLMDDWVQIMIDAANVSDYGKEKLAEARIKM